MTQVSDPEMASYIMAVFSSTQFITGVGLGLVLGYFVMSRKRNSSKDAPVPENDSESSSEDEGGEDKCGKDVKLILVVRNDLKMGKGKAAAQCAHAAVQAYQRAKSRKPQTLRAWERNGQPKIVVKCDSQEEMLELAKHSKALNLITSLIQDAGRTQILAGSRTVLGVGPGPASDVDKVTKHLKLY